jgi:hypothetical protein
VLHLRLLVGTKSVVESKGRSFSNVISPVIVKLVLHGWLTLWNCSTLFRAAIRASELIDIAALGHRTKLDTILRLTLEYEIDH